MRLKEAISQLKTEEGKTKRQSVILLQKEIPSPQRGEG